MSAAVQVPVCSARGRNGNNVEITREISTCLLAAKRERVIRANWHASCLGMSEYMTPREWVRSNVPYTCWQSFRTTTRQFETRLLNAA